jgi:hypothetical protein
LSCDGRDREVREALLSKGPKESFGGDIYVHYVDRLQWWLQECMHIVAFIKSYALNT